MPDEVPAKRDTLFLCWSGPRSKQVAEALKKYFEAVFEQPGPKVEMSDTLIDKGVPWSARLLDNLNTAGAGIVCLTPENRGSAWLHFEGGAIFSRPPDVVENDEQSANLFGFLFTLDNAQIDGPLSLFQTTVYRRDYDRDWEELKRLTRAVTGKFKTCRLKPDHETELDTLVGRLRELHYVVFRDLIPRLEQHARRIIQATAPEELVCTGARAHALSAVLALQHLLEDRARDIEVVCAPSQQMFFQRLIEAVSSAAVVVEQSIAEVPTQVPDARFRERVDKLRRMVEVAVEPLTPVLDDSWRYALYGLSGTRDEARHKQKLLLVHPLENRLQRAEISAGAGENAAGESRPEAVLPGHLLSLKEKPRALRSYWAWDRIAAYIHYCENVKQWEITEGMLLELTRGVLKEISLLEMPPAPGDDMQRDDFPIRFALRALVLKVKLAIGHGRYDEPLKTILDPSKVRATIEARIKGEAGLSFADFDAFIAGLRKLSARLESSDSTDLDEPPLFQPPLIRLIEDLVRVLGAAQSQSATA